MAAKKIMNSDIYNVASLVDELKKEYIPEETEATLSIGTYGYIGALESKRLQQQVIMTGELCNETFPSRARLERNVITHAITNGIININAAPSKMDVIIGIRQRDIVDLMKDDFFYLDRECPIYLEDEETKVTYEFHLEYDIIIRRIVLAGNEMVYTAQYDISRENPSSSITSPYINAPAVVILENEPYIFLNVIISQVEHHNSYKKIITSNIIDNKTANFDFDNQLAYFEVKVTEDGEEKYLTPVFEGAGVQEGIALYCWYQYIDVDKIRVRFDRNSYMPGLNAEVEILYKTTQGDAGNIRYDKDVYLNFESDKYGYRNVSVFLTPASDADFGKDRKSKKELQSLIPKESLARGSLTTITDLNNYFGMIDSESGRIVIQKKIDNQQERIYYAYLVLKDINGNIVPANTIDLKIPITAMERTAISDSESPRYVLKAGACFKLGSDGITAELLEEPIKYKKLSWSASYLMPHEGDEITVDFKLVYSNDLYKSINCIAMFADYVSNRIDTPAKALPSSASPEEEEEEPITGPVVKNNDYVSIGDIVMLSYIYTPIADGTVTFTPGLHAAFTFVKNSASYKLDKEVTEIESEDGASLVIQEAKKDKQYTLTFAVKVGLSVELSMDNTMHVENGSESKDLDTIRLHSVILILDENPTELEVGKELNYHVKFIDVDAFAPVINIEFSRGLEYVTRSGTVNSGENHNKVEPTISVVPDTEIGFLYTNPYTVSVSHYHLYSAFYMMCINTSPITHFEFINQKSAIQFITTNISWIRPFLGDKKDTYTMEIELTQSIAMNLGAFNEDAEDQEDINEVAKNIKVIALFYKDGAPYRYKNLTPLSADTSTYSVSFGCELRSFDILDQDNNIKIDNVGLINQYEEEYGFFNANTETKIYALVKLPDVDGNFNRHDLDAYVPGLDGWSVTNVYNAVNGIDFYYNYAEIMGSRVYPYGDTSKDILVPDGYYIKGVPVFGYDYCMDEGLVNDAIDALNSRKAYIDNALILLENSFGIDFKNFNTYGPAHTFYIIKDKNMNYYLDEEREFLYRINIGIKFRLKLMNSNDSYTRNQIIAEVKDYIEDLNELGEVHFPNLVTQIKNNYSEQIVYFEFLGVDDYGPSVQHLYKLDDSEIPIHTCPEFININNIIDIDGTTSPEITIYISEN